MPWSGPVAAVKVGMVDGDVVINPTEDQGENSTLNLTLAGGGEKINMIEAAGLEVDEEVDRLGFGHTLTTCKRKA